TPDAFYEGLRNAARVLPPDYPHPYHKEVEFALEWLRGRADLRDACARQDWEKVATMAKGLFAQDVPVGHAPAVNKAVERVDANRRLEPPLAPSSLARPDAPSRPDLLDDWPACATIADRGAKAKKLLPTLRQLQQESKAPGNGRRLVQLWRQHEVELTPWIE